MGRQVGASDEMAVDGEAPQGVGGATKVSRAIGEVSGACRSKRATSTRSGRTEPPALEVVEKRLFTSSPDESQVPTSLTTHHSVSETWSNCSPLQLAVKLGDQVPPTLCAAPCASSPPLAPPLAPPRSS